MSPPSQFDLQGTQNQERERRFAFGPPESLPIPHQVRSPKPRQSAGSRGGEAPPAKLLLRAPETVNNYTSSPFQLLGLRRRSRLGAACRSSGDVKRLNRAHDRRVRKTSGSYCLQCLNRCHCFIYFLCLSSAFTHRISSIH